MMAQWMTNRMTKWMVVLVALLMACSNQDAGDGAGSETGGGASKTASGIEITHLTLGTGANPTATDTVVVHYHGTFPDGSVFDSSVERGTPATFPLNRVIPCWTEGVQQIKVGGKAQLVCPPETAYGPRGKPPKIPKNATLHFEVELLEIK